MSNLWIIRGNSCKTARRMKRILLSMLVFLVLAASASAQVKVTGRVIDLQNKPVSDVIVKMVSGTKTLAFTSSNAKGEYALELKSAPRGEVTLQFFASKATRNRARLARALHRQMIMNKEIELFMNIRLEEPQDYREVENLTREAFWNVYRPGCTEHYVLNQYRNNPDFIPELDFVMEENRRIIGHVMFSKAEIMLDSPLLGGGAGGGAFPSWTFGPISIHPDYKRKGYGLKLLQYALEKAKEMGIGLLQMEGNIEFYKHTGFDLASKMKIHYHAVPRESEVPYFLAQELIPGYWGNREGTYCPPKGYFVADENPEAFEAYEATFPKKEKAFQEGQLPQFCQSCGMPLTKNEDCGKNADGSINYDYCKYCYAEGEFLQECTMDEMIEHCSQFFAEQSGKAERVDEVNKNMPKSMTKEEYKQMMRGFFPMLKRWKKSI